MRQVVPGRGRRGGSDWRASASCARNETPLRFTAAWPARRTRATPTEPVAGRRGRSYAPGGRTPRRRHTTSRARSEQPRRRRSTRHARARIRTKCDAPGDPGAPRTPRAEGGPRRGGGGGGAAAPKPMENPPATWVGAEPATRKASSTSAPRAVNPGRTAAATARPARRARRAKRSTGGAAAAAEPRRRGLKKVRTRLGSARRAQSDVY